jgi:hypothetical protein
MTGGRTRPVGEALPIESMVVAAEPAPHHNLVFEQAAIVEACRGAARSIAELSAELQVPLGVARVLVSDLRHMGQVLVREGIEAAADDAHVLERLITRVREL